MKVCKICGVLQPIQNFYLRTKKYMTVSGEERIYKNYESQCKTCKCEKVISYYSKNSEARRAYQREYIKSNPETPAKGQKVRQERMRQAPNDGVTPREVFVRDGGLCYSCGTQTTFQGGEMDHLLGYALPDCPGNVRENVAWMCKACNRKKPKKNFFAPAVALYQFQLAIKEA